MENDSFKIVVSLLPVGIGWPNRLDENVNSIVSAVNSELKILLNTEIDKEELKIFPNPTKIML